MPTTDAPRPTAPEARDRRARRTIDLGFLVLGAVLVVALVLAVAGRDSGAADRAAVADLPNPMGGPTLAAPGSAGGEATLDGLQITDTRVAMGDVPLDATVVPTWNVTNPTGEPLTFAAAQPQVLEGCCPGPVYADDAEVAPGQPIEVPPGASVRVAFPLQMHLGMDGPHHLRIPLAGAAGGEAALEVTGDFTADADV